MLCPIQRRRCWGERRKLLWTPALYDQYYHRNGPHSPTYSIAPFAGAFTAVRSHSSRGALDVCVCMCVYKALGLWWGFVIGVAGYVTLGRRRRGEEELSGKLWHDSSPNVEGRSNAGEWQRCGDKASCQSPVSVAHHLLPTPTTLHPRGAWQTGRRRS